MAVYTISDNTIKKFKRDRFLLYIPVAIITAIIVQVILFFLLDNKIIFFISLGLFVLSIPMVVFLSVKKGLKSLKNIQYLVDNERLIIRYGDYIQHNLQKDDIKCIDKYRNNIIINLKNGERICVNKNLENVDDLVDELAGLSTVHVLNKNDNQNIKTNTVYLLIGIITFILYGIFRIVHDNILIIISGSLIILFFIGTLIFIRTYKIIGKMYRIFLLLVFIFTAYIIIVEIFKRIH